MDVWFIRLICQRSKFRDYEMNILKAGVNVISNNVNPSPPHLLMPWFAFNCNTFFWVDHLRRCTCRSHLQMASEHKHCPGGQRRAQGAICLPSTMQAGLRSRCLRPGIDLSDGRTSSSRSCPATSMTFLRRVLQHVWHPVASGPSTYHSRLTHRFRLPNGLHWAWATLSTNPNNTGCPTGELGSSLSIVWKGTSCSYI